MNQSMIYSMVEIISLSMNTSSHFTQLFSPSDEQLAHALIYE